MNIKLKKVIKLDLARLLQGLSFAKIPTKLEAKLVDENYPLEEYLKDEEAIQCYKDMNKNAKKYFNKNKIKQLIKYITEEPKNDDYFIGHKFPYISCEMLKSECPYIQDLFVLTDNEYNEKYKNSEQNKININEKSIDKIDKNKKEDEKKDEEDTKEEDKKDEEKGEEEDKNKRIDAIEGEEKEDNIDLVKKPEKDEDKNEKVVESAKEDNKIDEMPEKENNKDTNDIKGKKENNNNTLVRNELFDLLLNYVMTDKTELNDVLNGYFTAVLSSLLDKYKYKLILYLYILRKDALDKISFFSYQSSLANISNKILNIDDIFNNDTANNANIKDDSIKYYSQLLNEKKDEILKYRNELVSKLILSISNEGIKNLELGTLFSLLLTLNQVKSIVKHIVNDQKVYYHIFEILDKNIANINEKEQKVYDFFILFLKELFSTLVLSKSEFNLIGTISSDKISEIIEGKKDNLNFFTYYISILTIILKFNFVENSEHKLGRRNHFIIDLVFQTFIYMREMPMIIDTILIKTDFIKKSIDFFFKYQLNNIYQHKFVKLFIIYLENEAEHSILRDYLFKEIKFHEKLADYINNEENIAQRPLKENKEEIDNKNNSRKENDNKKEGDNEKGENKEDIENKEKENIIDEKKDKKEDIKNRENNEKENIIIEKEVKILEKENEYGIKEEDRKENEINNKEKKIIEKDKANIENVKKSNDNINNDNKIIEEKNEKEEENIKTDFVLNKKKSKKEKSLIYPYIIELSYKIQTIIGLKTFDEKEQKDLGILNLGNFEFVKDENSVKTKINIVISDKLKEIIQLSEKWKTTFEKKIMPVIRRYESKLYAIKEIEKPKENASNANNIINLLNMITNSLKSKTEELKNKKKEEKIEDMKNKNNSNDEKNKDKCDNYEVEHKEYNDNNYWQVKTESLINEKEMEDIINNL